MDILYLYYYVPSAAVTYWRDFSVCRVVADAKIDTPIDIDMYIDTDTEVYRETH